MGTEDMGSELKVLFLQQDVFCNYGVMLLSSVLKSKGTDCHIMIEPLEPDFYSSIKKLQPDIICFSIATARLSWMKKVAKEIKSFSNSLIVVGGSHPTFFPEVINDNSVDAICIGEGEQAFAELVDSIRDGKDFSRIKNLWVKKDGKIFKNGLRNLIEDLDILPFADRELYLKYDFFKQKDFEYFLTARGCPYACTFCFNAKYNKLYANKGSVLRKHSVEYVMEDIKQVLGKRKNTKHLVFLDDTFILGKKTWFDKFFERYEKEVALPYSVTARADLVKEELVKKMSSSGCNSVRMGIESANDFIREKVLKKGITKQQITKAVKLIKSNGMKLQLYNILGSPYETLETALETYEFNKNLNPDYAWCSLMQPYPGTEIAEVAKEQGLLDKNFGLDDLESSYFSDLPLDLEHKKEMISLQRLFQFGNAFHIPKKVMRQLIRVPPNAALDWLFKINYGLGIKKLDDVSWSNLFRTAMYSKSYFSKKADEKK